VVSRSLRLHWKTFCTERRSLLLNSRDASTSTVPTIVDCFVPHGYSEDPSLAEWVHRQRTTYAQLMKDKHPSQFLVERMKQLEDLGFHFSVHTAHWMENFNELKQYKLRHGNCDVPTHCPDNPKLGRWVHTQRHNRRLQLKGSKKSCMNDERVALLESLGFSWEAPHKPERKSTSWQERFDELRQFVGQYHHFCVPIEAMPELHAWCVRQKQRLQRLNEHEELESATHDGARAILLERDNALESIGFTKDVQLERSHQHKRQYGHLDCGNEEVGFGEALDDIIAGYSDDQASLDVASERVNDVPTTGDIFHSDYQLQANGNVVPGQARAIV